MKECETKLMDLVDIFDYVLHKEYLKDDWKRFLNILASIFSVDVAALGEKMGRYIYYIRYSDTLENFLPDYDPFFYRIPINVSAFRETLRRRTAVAVEDYQNYELAVPSWKRAGLKSVLIYPLAHRRVFGSLALATFKEKRRFSEFERKLFIRIAQAVASILEDHLHIKRLKKEATRDNLTGMYNRGVIETKVRDILGRSDEQRQPLSLIMIDIDNFKKINDSYGHIIGDRVLKRVAEIIRDSIRRTDIAIRYGGEEFLILLPSTLLEEAVKIAERIRRSVEKMDFPENLKLTVSAGVAQMEEGEDIWSLINRADMALYEAKRKGKNRVCTG